jgi:queuine tRNA-ribosyltransferase
MQWELLEGDFLAQLEKSAVPDLIFYDPFSAKTDSALWTADAFARIAKHCISKSTELYTYSAATAVRVALLSTGFFVGEGVGTGPKASTTLAFNRANGATQHPGSPHLLGHDWLARWNRSGSKYPSGLPEEAKAAFAQRISTHPQFATST